MRIPRPLMTCPICGTVFKSRTTRGKRQKTCSKKCNYDFLYPQGTLENIASKNGMTKKQFMQMIDKEHNEDLETLKSIAEKYGMARITLTRWCKQYGIKTRTVSEDNQRRYSTMSDAEKKMQTQKANEGIRDLFKNPEWKEEQIRKVMESQNFKRSAPELLFEKLLNEKGYYPISQYSEGMAGFIIDFAFPEIKLAIEIDGEYWHNLPNTKKRDRCKNYFLSVKKGWELIRIPASDFTHNTDHYIWEVIQTIETLKVA